PPHPDKDPDAIYAWTDITYLLHRAGVSWGYYVVTGEEPDCPTGDTNCAPRFQDSATPGHYNPLQLFETVKDNGQKSNIQSYANSLAGARSGHLPAVSWIVPSKPVSDHPGRSPADGQAFVTNIINTVGRGPAWESTAIFLAWDDWGGFYDHVVPP